MYPHKDAAGNLQRLPVQNTHRTISFAGVCRNRPPLTLSRRERGPFVRLAVACSRTQSRAFPWPLVPGPWPPRPDRPHPRAPRKWPLPEGEGTTRAARRIFPRN